MGLHMSLLKSRKLTNEMSLIHANVWVSVISRYWIFLDIEYVYLMVHCSTLQLEIETLKIVIQV